MMLILPVNIDGCKEYYDFNDLQTIIDLDIEVEGQQTTVPVVCDHVASGGGWTVCKIIMFKYLVQHCKM